MATNRLDWKISKRALWIAKFNSISEIGLNGVTLAAQTHKGLMSKINRFEIDNNSKLTVSK